MLLKSSLLWFLLVVFASVSITSTVGCKQDQVDQEVQPAQKELARSGPYLKSDQESYLRYEVVQIDLFLPGVDIESAKNMAVEARGKIYKDGEQVLGVAGFSDFPLSYDPHQGCWVGKWAMPWNPQLGEYQAVVTAVTPEGNLKLSAQFEICGKSPSKDVSFPLTAVTLETDTRYDRIKFMQPDGSLGDWQGVIDWAEFMGADSVWYLTGLTKAMYYPTPDEPFREYNFELAKKLGAYAHQRGLKFGAWIGCFLPYGRTQPDVGAKFSRNYVEGSFIYTLHFSLADEKRKGDIIDIVRWMDGQAEIDYIGFDYIRTGFGGYELVDEFVRDLGLEVPEDFWQRRLEGRMLWLVSKLANRVPGWIELWQWWRASKVARLVKELVEASGTEKPIFCFTLGWEMGHQHGQDVLMMNDAGVDFVALMLYEATRDEFDYMMLSWPQCIKDNQANLVLGNCLNEHLLDNKWYPGQIAPKEYFDRSVTALEKLYPDGVPEGIFWHDMDRALSGLGGDFPVMEFALAGGAAFSAVREMNGTLPLAVHIKDIGESGAGDWALEVELINHTSADIEDVMLQIPPTLGVKPAQKEWSLGKVPAGQTMNITLPLSMGRARYTLLVGVLCTWGEGGVDERSFDVVTVHIFKKPKEKVDEGTSEVGGDSSTESMELSKDGF